MAVIIVVVGEFGGRHDSGSEYRRNSGTHIENDDMHMPCALRRKIWRIPGIIYMCNSRNGHDTAGGFGWRFAKSLWYLYCATINSNLNSVY